MAVLIQMKLNTKLYLRDPQLTELGRNIISNSIMLIEKLGFEEFTFKKLAAAINSTEASIYRYFENKHNLLVYLVSWYWAWLEYQIDFKTNNIPSPEKKLHIFIDIIAESSVNDPDTLHIDEALLHKIVISESSKVYLTKQVDEENKEGFFANYKSLCRKVADIITEIDPKYPYPRSLATTLIETAHGQLFFAQHLPSLSEVKKGTDTNQQIAQLLLHMVSNLLKLK